MSDHTPLPPDEEQDRAVIAGLYVLCLLDEGEARAVRQDPGMQGLIAQWEDRLAPLARLVPPVAPPPQLWARIAFSIRADTAPRAIAARPAWRHSVRAWQIASAGLFATAIVFAALLIGQPGRNTPPPTWTAILQPARIDTPALFASLDRSGNLTLQGPEPSMGADAHHDYELWILPEGETTPRSLGVVRALAPRQIGTSARNHVARLMVSLEPHGGSPTGAPTGPVVLSGTLHAAAI